MAKPTVKGNMRILMIMLLLIVAAIIYVSWDKIMKLLNKQRDTAATQKLGTVTTKSGVTVSKTLGNLNLDRKIKKGDTGEEVRLLQKIMNAWEPKNTVNEDGNWGPLTEKKYQRLVAGMDQGYRATLAAAGVNTNYEPVTLNQVLYYVVDAFGCDDPNNCPMLDLLRQIYPANN